MRVRGRCATAAILLSAYSAAYPVFAQTAIQPSPQNFSNASSSASSNSALASAVDAAEPAKNWANLLVADSAPVSTLPANSISGMPACDPTGSVRIAESQRQAAYLNFNDSSVADGSNPAAASRLFGNPSGGNGLAADSVNANFSSLSTNLALRGRYCTSQFGSTKVTAAVGMFADDWASLSAGQLAPTRDAAAAKVEQDLDENLKGFVTAQGYQYDQSGLPVSTSVAPLARAQAVTTGLNYHKGRFGLVAEVGGSRRDDGFQNEQDSSAAALDGTWQASDSVTFRLGHRDLGRNYASLSGTAMAGMAETYTGAKWNATRWLSLDTDLRRSQNRLATDAIARDTVSLMTSATIAIPQFVGWGVNLQALQVAGGNADRSNNDLMNYGAMVRYATGLWQTGFGVTQGTFDNARSAGAGTSAGFNYDVAVFWNDVMDSVPRNWNARFSFGTTYQHQDYDSGITTRNSNANIGVALQHQQWGMFSAALARGRVDQVTGGSVDSQSYLSEYSRPLSRNNSVKVYYRQTRTMDYTSSSLVRDQSAGVQFVLAQ